MSTNPTTAPAAAGNERGKGRPERRERRDDREKRKESIHGARCIYQPRI